MCNVIFCGIWCGVICVIGNVYIRSEPKMTFMYMLKCRDPSMDPWATPDFILSRELKKFFVLCLRSVRELYMNCSELSSKPHCGISKKIATAHNNLFILQYLPSDEYVIVFSFVIKFLNSQEMNNHKCVYVFLWSFL